MAGRAPGPAPRGPVLDWGPVWGWVETVWWGQVAAGLARGPEGMARVHGLEEVSRFLLVELG
ncbi:hypothetical protein D3C85_1578140 [compost metagenome]